MSRRKSIFSSFSSIPLALLAFACGGIATLAEEKNGADLELTIRIRGGAGNLAQVLQSLEAYGNIEVVRAVTVESGDPMPQPAERVATGSYVDAPGPYSPRYREYNDVVGIPLHYDYRYGYSGRDDFEGGYRQGRRDGRLITELEQQPYRFGPIYQDAMARAETSMKNGHYPDAARQYLLAAEQYKGDPISRQRAAHALFASGNYSQALQTLDRAFDLQPKLLYRDYRPSKEFPSDQAFAEQIAALTQAAQAAPTPNELWALLAYLQFAEGRLDEAATAVKNAPQAKPKLSFVTRLRELVVLDPSAR